MKIKQLKPPVTELDAGLRTLMFVRVLFVSILLDAGLFININETETYFGPVQTIHFSLLGSIYFLSIIYLILFRMGKARLALAYFQLTADALFAALIMTVTGGIHSVFSLFFVLVIITAAILLYRSGGLIIATVSSVLYGSVVALHYWNIWQSWELISAPPRTIPGTGVLYLAFVNILAFYVVAFLTSYLSEMARKSKTELDARQEDLHQLESLTDGIIKSINSGVVALDHNGKVVLFNPASETIFHTRASQAIGKNLTEVIPWLDQSPGTEGKTVVGNFGDYSKLRDLSFQDKTGTTVHLRYSISPLRLSSRGAFGQIIVVQDITEIRKIEEEMEKVRSLALIGELAAGIAHEIRNPMASISGSIQMLKEELSDNQMHSRLVDIVLKEINRLNQLVSDFLVFARPRRPSMEKFDFNKLVRETLELFTHTPHWVSKINIHSRLDANLPVNSDPQLAKQVLWNLLRNACEAMPSGGDLHIYTSVSSNGDGQSIIALEVRDTGPGLTQTNAETIFRPFFTTKKDGSGLGLAIVKRVVEVLGGHISGENHPDGGACFRVTIPSSGQGTP